VHKLFISAYSGVKDKSASEFFEFAQAMGHIAYSEKHPYIVSLSDV